MKYTIRYAFLILLFLFGSLVGCSRSKVNSDELLIISESSALDNIMASANESELSENRNNDKENDGKEADEERTDKEKVEEKTGNELISLKYGETNELVLFCCLLF